MQRESAIVPTLLEMHMPTSFFDSQVQLLIHLVQEVGLAGPLKNRYMFFIERFLKTLKGFVKQRVHPKGNTMERYLVQEVMNKCHDLIRSLNQYALRIWKKTSNARKMGMITLT
jgi:hypothetical protein